MNDAYEKMLTTYLLNGVLLPKDIQLYTEYISGTRVLTPTHKYAQILYLLYLEYASRCAGYVIQDKNPIKSLTFHNSMRGPFAFHAFYSSDEIYSNIIAGRVPRFSDLNISPAEKPCLDETIATVKSDISPMNDLAIEYALISYALPLHKRFPLVASPISLTDKNVNDEVSAYLKHRKELICGGKIR